MTKKIKKTTAFLSAVAMVMAMLLYFPSGMFSNIDWGLKASAEGETQTENWIAFAATEFAGGTGTEGDPYQIATADQLACLAKQVNAGTNYSGVFFKLTAEINLGGKEWTPIGTNFSNAFTGEFSGDGHKITNLKIESTGDYVGLFGCNMGKITNVGIEGGSVKGGKYVGGVCGSNSYGTITNCYNTASVTGGEDVGGVCGENYQGTITNCYNTGDIIGKEYTVSNSEESATPGESNTGSGSETKKSSKVGGVCGENYEGTITNCYNTGEVTSGEDVGGVCGSNGYGGTILNCYNTGKVTGTGEYNVGGVCGSNGYKGTITNCYYLAGKATGGINGSDVDGSAKAIAYTTLCDDTKLPTGFDSSVWANGKITGNPIEEGSRFGTGAFVLPSLIDVGTAQTISTGADKLFYNFSTTDEPDWQDYTPIRTAEELQAIGKDSTSLGKNYVLMEDIDLKDITNFTPIGTDKNNAFTGKFSGNGHKIKNLTINSESKNVGLFGFSNGTIMNVGIEGGSVTGKDSVGGVCGYNEGGTISNCYNTASVTGGDSVGGVCGFINGCTISNCYNTGNVSGSDNSGGVCGWNNYGAISNCYNTGVVSGNSHVGGVCGYNEGGTIANCYFDSKVYNGNAVVNNNGTVSENVLGKTTKQFTSGEVAYLLSQDGSVWGQEIGKDLYPVLGGKKVYLTTGECVYYTNTFYEEEQSHSYKNGICDNCGGYDPAKQNSNGEYEISNAGQLYWFAALVNGTLTGVTQNKSANAVLTADITVNTGDVENAVANCGGTKQDGWIDWTPIGNNSNQFSGTFDGQGHTISGLYFNNPDTSYVGLFGYSGGTIKNVGVVDSYFKGKESVGGVCGFNDAYNYNSTATITNCYNTGYVSGNNSVGGVCGYNFTGKITNCYNTGAVNGTGDAVGGVCGFTTGGTIANCYFDSTVYNGNAVGDNYGTDSANVLGKETTQFTSGEVAYLLSQGCTVGGTIYNGDVWGQDLSTEDYPVLGGATVYLTTGCVTYHNTLYDGDKPHIYEGGVCVDCGMLDPALANKDYPTKVGYTGEALAAPTAENFTYSGAGELTFTWYAGVNELDTPPTNAGAYTLVVAIGESGDYGASAITLDVKIVKGTPEYTVPVATATYGQTLKDVDLPDGFAWQDEETTSVGNAGEHTFKVTFTPTDTDNYNVVEDIEMTIDVAKAEPEYTVPVATATYGQTLKDVELPAGFTWQDEETTSVGNAGEHTFKVTFTPTDTDNYNVVEDIEITINVAKADPTIIPTIEDKTYSEGDAIPAISIDKDDTPGTIKWLDVQLEALEAGENVLTWEFTPTDKDNYNVVTGTMIVAAETTTTTTTTTTTATTTSEETTTTTGKETTTGGATSTTSGTTTSKASSTTTTTEASTIATTTTTGKATTTSGETSTTSGTTTSKASSTTTTTKASTIATITTTGKTTTTSGATSTVSGTTSEAATSIGPTNTTTNDTTDTTSNTTEATTTASGTATSAGPTNTTTSDTTDSTSNITEATTTTSETVTSAGSTNTTTSDTTATTSETTTSTTTSETVTSAGPTNTTTDDSTATTSETTTSATTSETVTSVDPTNTTTSDTTDTTTSSTTETTTTTTSGKATASTASDTTTTATSTSTTVTTTSITTDTTTSTETTESTTSTETTSATISATTDTSETTATSDTTTTTTNTTNTTATGTTDTTTTTETEQTVLTGDANQDGKVDPDDAYMVLVYYAEEMVGKEHTMFNDPELEKLIIEALDIDKDGNLDADDAYLILLYYAQISVGADVTWEDLTQ